MNLKHFKKMGKIVTNFRIGNFLNEKWWNSTSGQYEYSLIIISSIHKTHIRCQDDNAYNIEDTEVIPLTEEWLLKFGFEEHFDKTEELYYWALKDFVLEPTFVCFGYADPIVYDLIRVNEKNPLKHVHQLQNLYFALTGEELTLSK